jgi:hypothetical protein
MSNTNKTSVTTDGRTGLRRRLAISAAAVFAVAGCVAVENPRSARRNPPPPPIPASSQQSQARPPEVVLGPGAPTSMEPTIQRGTGNFVDPISGNRSGRGNSLMSTSQRPCSRCSATRSASTT